MSDPKDRRIVLYYAIGKRLRRIREERGLSQDDLADACGLVRTSITNIENGNQRADLETLYLVAKRLDCAITDFLPEYSPRLFRKVEDVLAEIIETGQLPSDWNALRGEKNATNT